MSTRIKNESRITQLIKKKKRLLYSKISYALQTDHEHYYHKKDVLEFTRRHITKSNIDPCCKVCGLPLSKYRDQVRFDTLEIPAYKDSK